MIDSQNRGFKIVHNIYIDFNGHIVNNDRRKSEGWNFILAEKVKICQTSRYYYNNVFKELLSSTLPYDAPTKSNDLLCKYHAQMPKKMILPNVKDVIDDGNSMIAKSNENMNNRGIQTEKLKAIQSTTGYIDLHNKIYSHNIKESNYESSGPEALSYNKVEVHLNVNAKH